MDIHFYFRTKWLSLGSSLFFHILIISLTLYFGYKIVDSAGSPFGDNIPQGPARVSFGQPLSKSNSQTQLGTSLPSASGLLNPLDSMGTSQQVIAKPKKARKRSQAPAVTPKPKISSDISLTPSPTALVDNTQKDLVQTADIPVIQENAQDTSDTKQTESDSDEFTGDVNIDDGGTVSSSLSNFTKRNVGITQSLYRPRQSMIPGGFLPNITGSRGSPSYGNSGGHSKAGSPSGSAYGSGEKPKRITAGMLASAYNNAFNGAGSGPQNTKNYSRQIELDQRVEELNFGIYFGKISERFRKAAKHFRKQVNFKDSMYQIVTINITVNEDKRIFDIQEDQLTGIKEIDDCIVDFIKSVELPPVPKKLKGQTLTQQVTFKMNCDKGSSIVYFVPA